MKDNSREIEFSFRLPEFDRKDINLHITKNSLSINARKKSEKKIKRKDFFHQERTERHFNYVTTLPNIKIKKAKIEFKKGILKIKAPKE